MPFLRTEIANNQESGGVKLQSLLKKHSAAIKVAGLLIQKRDENQQKKEQPVPTKLKTISRNTKTPHKIYQSESMFKPFSDAEKRKYVAFQKSGVTTVVLILVTNLRL